MKEPISRREVEVLELAKEGKVSKEIGAELHIAPSTVAVHKRNIMRKLGTTKETSMVWQYGLRKFGNCDF